VREGDRYNEASGGLPLRGIARAARLELVRRRLVQVLRERRQAGGRLEARDRDASAALELAERFDREGRI
jgi:hypothetical protein